MAGFPGIDNPMFFGSAIDRAIEEGDPFKLEVYQMLDFEFTCDFYKEVEIAEYVLTDGAMSRLTQRYADDRMECMQNGSGGGEQNSSGSTA